MKTKSQRQLQIGEQIKRIIADIFAREGMSSISGSYITISQADVSPDIKNCTIYVNIFGNEKNRDAILTKLNGSASFFRRELGRNVAFRSTPEIKFILDKTEEEATTLESLINKESQKFSE